MDGDIASYTKWDTFALIPKKQEVKTNFIYKNSDNRMVLSIIECK